MADASSSQAEQAKFAQKFFVNAAASDRADSGAGPFSMTRYTGIHVITHAGMLASLPVLTVNIVIIGSACKGVSRAKPTLTDGT